MASSLPVASAARSVRGGAFPGCLRICAYATAYLKIDVGQRLITCQARFADGRKYLVVTGERAQESKARAHYRSFEPDRADNRSGQRARRHIDHWRPVHGWSEAAVWAILREFGVVPHPAYWLGFGRTSCMACIFGSANQWATVRALAPERFETIARYEDEFGCTIQRDHSVRALADRGRPYPADPYWVQIALSTRFSLPMRVSESEWRLPAGAFGESCGPL